MTTTVDAKLNDNELKVLDLIRLAGWEGKTCDEIEVETGLTHQGASAHITPRLARHHHAQLVIRHKRVVTTQVPGLGTGATGQRHRDQGREQYHQGEPAPTHQREA